LRRITKEVAKPGRRQKMPRQGKTPAHTTKMDSARKWLLRALVADQNRWGARPHFSGGKDTGVAGRNSKDAERGQGGDETTV